MLSQEEFMQKALHLAARGRYLAPPNPWVGCVIVQQGRIVGQGYTQPFGQAHAEVIALREAKEQAKGATLFVTLEPCAHVGKTPPCTKALIEAGIAKVVVAMVDPDQKVSGRGIRALQEAGIEVEVGLLGHEAHWLLAPYVHHRKTGRPYCILKVATSVDGKMAAADGSSQWITGEEARKNAHQLRATSQAILIGAGTALHDLPQLTVRDVAEEHKPPLRVLLDRRGEVPVKGPLFNPALAPTLIVTSNPNYKASGVEVFYQESFSIKEVLEELGKRGVVQLLVEGGSKMYTNFLKEGFCNRLVVYMGGCLLGGEGHSFCGSLGISSIEQAKRLTLASTERLGQDIRLDYI